MMQRSAEKTPAKLVPTSLKKVVMNDGRISSGTAMPTVAAIPNGESAFTSSLKKTDSNDTLKVSRLRRNKSRKRNAPELGKSDVFQNRGQSPLTIDTTMTHLSSCASLSPRTMTNWKVLTLIRRFSGYFGIRFCVVLVLMLSTMSFASTTWYMTLSRADIGALDLPPDQQTSNAIRTEGDEFISSKIRDQNFLFIIGSVGSGFRYLEKDLVRWSEDYKIRPYSYALPNISPKSYNTSEGFLPLMDALCTKVTSAPRGFPSHNRTKSNLSAFFIEEFRQGLNTQWIQNKNVIMGSDSFQFILGKNERKIGKFVDELIGLLPWNDERFSLSGSNNRTTALVLYHQSRIKHAQMAWKASLSKLSFAEWMVSRDSFNYFDTFSIAEKLYLRGIDIDIIDVDHVIEMKLNLSHFIVCHILNLKCSDDGYLENIEGNSTVRASGFKVSEDEVDVDQAKLIKLDSIIHEYECCFDFLREGDVRFFPATRQVDLRFRNCKCDNHDNARKRFHRKIKDVLGQYESTK